MDDKDHVFGRFKDHKPASAERHERLSIPGRGGTSSSRSVDVVHTRLGGALAAKASTRRSALHDRVAPWEGSFPAHEVKPPPTVTEPDVAEASPPVTHVMPAWEPSVVAAEVATVVRDQAPDAEEMAAIAGGRPRRRKATRRVADPFDAADDGANCLRCGYAIEPARETRGLMICAGCV